MPDGICRLPAAAARPHRVTRRSPVPTAFAEAPHGGGAVDATPPVICPMQQRRLDVLAHARRPARETETGQAVNVRVPTLPMKLLSPG